MVLTRRSRPLALSVLGVGVALLAFDLLPWLGLVSRREVPSVVTIGRTLVDEVVNGALLEGAWNTLRGWAIGLGLATLVAVPCGALLGLNRTLARSLRFVIDFLRPVPPVALIPVAVLLYGTGEETKVALVALSAFWPILFQTIYGVQDVDPVAVDCVRAYGLGWRQRFVRLVLPSAMPYLVTGLRIASSVAVIVAVATELVLGAPGLGAQINAAQVGGSAAVAYAYIVATGLLGWALNVVVRRLEARLLFWHPSQRGEVPA